MTFERVRRTSRDDRFAVRSGFFGRPWLDLGSSIRCVRTTRAIPYGVQSGRCGRRPDQRQHRVGREVAAVGELVADIP